MIQLYFLSILLNSLAGYLFFLGDKDKDDTIETSLRFSLHSPAFRLILGILCAAVGVLKLLSPSMGIINVPILGDLVPALAGIIAGFTLVFGYYREHSAASLVESSGKVDRLGELFLRYKRGMGIVMLAAALLHFLFPQALFL